MTRGQDEADWSQKMKRAMSECFRVLKPGRCMSLCYHDSSEGSWTSLQDLMAECGFVIEEGDHTVYIDTDRKSWKQIVADKVTKRDLVINYRKPAIGQLTSLTIGGPETKTTFAEKVRHVIHEFLTTHPGSSEGPNL